MRLVHNLPGMQLVCLLAAGVEGVEGFPVTVEVHRDSPSFGTGRTSIVGLPDAAVREGMERVLPAVMASGLAHRPTDHVVVNLAPADRRKEGAAFDLAIALGLTATMEENGLPALGDDLGLLAELALDGRLRPVRGVLAMAVALRDAGVQRLAVAPENAAEAAVVAGLDVRAPRDLRALVEGLRGAWTDLPRPPAAAPTTQADEHADLSDVRGQDHAKRALMICAAGGHNLLMIGPPGSGKTMLARRLPGLLPPMTDPESLEVTRIHSVAGLLDHGAGLVRRRPFRAPHHSVSAVGLIGGGPYPRPGEVSLAHHGVLFLDELPEYPRPVLESLRQPLEDGHLTISRSAARLDFPSRCMLVAAMNPCPCGWLGHPTRACTDNQEAVHRYRRRISGPLLDRIDLHLEVPAQKPQALDAPASGPDSATVRERVLAARQRMLERQRRANAALDGRGVRQHCRPDDAGMALLHQAVEELGLSARAHDRILKVARTIADLDGHEKAGLEQVSEAIGYRLLDRQTW